MKQDKERDEVLFDSQRKAPAELKPDQVAKMIKGIAAGTVTSSLGSSWTDFLNLNNFLMISLPATVAIGLVMYTVSISTQPQTNSQEQPIPNDIRIEQHFDPDESRQLSELEKEQPIWPENADLQSQDSSKSVSSETQDHASLATLLAGQKLPASLDRIAAGQVQTDAAAQILSPTVAIAEQGKETTEFDKNPVVSATGSTVLRELSGAELKRMKRGLYSNLIEDKLVRSKRSFVALELRVDEILVNERPLPEQLFHKYRDLTSAVGYGPERRIEMDGNHIKAGDFGEEGFNGYGVGTWTAGPGQHRVNEPASALLGMETDASDWGTDTFDSASGGDGHNLFEKSEEWEEMIDNEGDQLRNFADDVRKRPKSGVVPIINSANYNGDECEQMHEDLYIQLILDNVVEGREEFVLIELAKSGLIINGEKVNAELERTFDAILKRHKIKRGSRKEIQLSAHIIAIGSVGPDHFTGTYCLFDEND